MTEYATCSGRADHLSPHLQPTEHTVQLSLGEFSSAEVALKGATVFSYKQNGVERLFTSSKSDVRTADPAAVRGGVPICWPIFGPPPKDNALYNKLKQHGFARTSVWEYIESESHCDGEKGVKAVFRLEPNSAIEALFSLPFSLTYTVHLTPSSLDLSLKVSSPSSAIAPLPFQALLHSYFRLPSSVLPPRVKVSPLENLRYADKVQGGKEETERRKVVTVDGPEGEVDRVYLRAPDRLKVSYEGHPGSIELKKKNLVDVVLWNPGPEKAKTIGDMEENGADRYICLEPGQTSQWVSLEPGQTWEGSIEVAFSDSD
ncbi:glucose-6-phosphate 1-epimerase [Sporobolomyces koalae]|uniref:glucose-6-phosphate 1-epimerase n=1 Tax=Sporobolomyces koalae TaxID=500713 RepID=UPI00316C1DB7